MHAYVLTVGSATHVHRPDDHVALLDHQVLVCACAWCACCVTVSVTEQ